MSDNRETAQLLDAIAKALVNELPQAYAISIVVAVPSPNGSPNFSTVNSVWGRPDTIRPASFFRALISIALDGLKEAGGKLPALPPPPVH